MAPEDLTKLLQELSCAIAERPGSRVAVVGRAQATAQIVGFVSAHSQLARFIGVYAPDGDQGADPVATYVPIERLRTDRPDLVVIAEDEGKEALLIALSGHVAPGTRILLGGYAHLDFHDPVFRSVVRDALVPSLANGYPNCLVHLYQCLRAAARLGLDGVVAEFGMYRGGTTMLLSRFIEVLGAQWKVIGFDTFNGFPSPRNALDLYAHPDCVFRGEAAVRNYLRDRNVEIIAGDVVSTVGRLAKENLVLAFIDTDNYTSASAILDVITDRVAVGGAIVFDHWAGLRRHLYTVGERIAASRLVSDVRFLNLHDTGVFLKLV